MKGRAMLIARWRPLLVAACVAVVLWLLLAGAELWVEHKVGHLLSPHALHIGDVDVSLLRRSVTLHDVRLDYNTARQGRQDMGRPIVEVSVGRLSASGVALRRSGGRIRVALGELSVESPDIHIYRNADVRRVSDSAAAVALPFVLDSVGEIVVTGARLGYDRWKDGSRVSWRATGLDLRLSGMVPDSLGIGGLAWREASAAAAGMDYTFGGGSMMLSLGGLRLDTATGSLSADSLKLLPQRWGKYDYARNTAGHPDWTRVVAGDVRCEGVDFAALRGGEVRMDSLVVGRADIQSYKTRKVAVEPRRKGLFYVALQQLPVGLDIGGVRVAAADVVYEELALGGVTPGRVSITGISARSGRVANGGRAERLELSASGLLEGSGRLDVAAVFPVVPSGRFSMEGHVGAMDMRAFNPMVKPLVNAEVLSGVMDGLDFRMTGDSISAQADVEFLYRDFTVSMYKVRKGQVRERKLLNGLVDNVVLHRNNPGKNGRVRPGSGTFVRDPYKSQFNYFYRTLVAGIRKAVVAL